MEQGHLDWIRCGIEQTVCSCSGMKESAKHVLRIRSQPANIGHKTKKPVRFILVRKNLTGLCRVCADFNQQDTSD